MLSVDIEKIIPVTEARDMFNKIIDEVEGSDDLYVLTKNGKPAAVVVGINHLEKLTGETDTEVMAKIGQVGQNEPANDNFIASGQFNTKDAVTGATDQVTADSTPTEPVAPQAEPIEKTPAEPITTTETTDKAPVQDSNTSATGVKDDISFGGLPPNNSSTETADPFAPSSTPAPTEEVKTNPPGSTGGVSENLAPAQPPDQNKFSTDPMTGAPSQSSDDNPTTPNPQE